MTLIHPRRAIVYWDVTDISKKARILRDRDDADFYRFPADEGVVSDHHFLRAYNAGYFKLLRQSVLSGLTAHSVTWILEKAKEHWKKSPDKVLRHIWLRRIAWDKKALAEGLAVATGDLPSLDPNWKPSGVISVLDTTPRVTSLKWICDFIYLHRERKESFKPAGTEAVVPPADGAKMDTE